MRNELKNMLVVAQWDLIKLKNQRIFLAMRLAWFTIQVLVFARAISYIVKQAVSEIIGVDYYYFYVLGVYTSLLYSTGISRGYIIADEFDDGIVEYHLSLPVKRSVLAIGRVLGSALSAVIFTTPMILVIMLALYFSKPFTLSPLSITAMVLSIMAFSIGVVSFVVLLVMKVRSTDATDILLGVIDAFLVRLSTVFYPLPVVEASGIQPYYVAVLVNPISHMTDFLRVLVFPEYELVLKYGLHASLLYVLGLAMGLLILAVEYFEKRLEAGGWK